MSTPIKYSNPYNADYPIGWYKNGAQVGSFSYLIVYELTSLIDSNQFRSLGQNGFTQF